MPSNFSFNASMSHQIFLITDPRQPIRAKEERLRLAMLASDTEVLDELISPNFNFTNQFGQLFSKEDELGLHRSGVLAFHALEPSEPDLRGDDQCIVVSVRMKVSGTYGGLEFRSDLRYTRVWRSSPDGTWQLVVAHSSSVV